MLGKLRAYMVTVGVIGLVLLVLLAMTVNLDRFRADWALVATLLVLAVEDDGASVQPLQRERIFER